MCKNLTLFEFHKINYVNGKTVNVGTMDQGSLETETYSRLKHDRMRWTQHSPGFSPMTGMLEMYSSSGNGRMADMARDTPTPRWRIMCSTRSAPINSSWGSIRIGVILFTTCRQLNINNFNLLCLLFLCGL